MDIMTSKVPRTTGFLANDTAIKVVKHKQVYLVLRILRWHENTHDILMIHKDFPAANNFAARTVEMTGEHYIQDNIEELV